MRRWILDQKSRESRDLRKPFSLTLRSDCTQPMNLLDPLFHSAAIIAVFSDRLFDRRNYLGAAEEYVYCVATAGRSKIPAGEE
jgi:hypothetical protein